MENIINALQSNPIFSMSLGSKELFHSNFLEYLWCVNKGAFIKMINGFLLEEKKLPKKDYHLGREKENFDLCIFHEEDGKDIYDLVIENKVKSMPYKEQLKEYVNKARKKKSIGCRFILLTLTKDFPDKDDEEINKNWSIVGYDSLKDGIRTHFLNSRIQLANNESYIRDYNSFVEQLIELKKTIISTDDILNSSLFEKSEINSLKEIRLHDLYIKLRCSWFALTLRKKLIEKRVEHKDIHIINKYDDREHGINLNVTINQGNGQIAAWICDCSEGEKGKGNTFEVVIQGDQYRHGINQNSVGIGGNDKFEKLNSCYKNLLKLEDAKNFLDFGAFSSFGKDVYPAKADRFRKTKKDEQSHDKIGPFCCYGEYYIYRYKNIENEVTIGKLLEIMADDVSRLFSSIPKLE